MTLQVSVPTKIVIMGTSSMSLNERFSNIKKIAPAKQVVRPSRKSLLSASRLSLAAPVEDVYEEEYDDELMEQEVYDPTYATVRRTHNPTIQRQRFAPIYRSAVPLQERVSFSGHPYQVATYTNGFQHVATRGRAGFRNNFNRAAQQQNGGFRYNPNYGRLNAGNGFQQKRFNNQNGGFPPRYGNARGGRFGGKFQKKAGPKHTAEELDRELDAYMKKSTGAVGSGKHVPITI